MTPIKIPTTKIQEIEKRNHQEVLAAFTEQNFNLNLCKTFLSKLIESHLTSIEIKRSIKDFLNDLNQKS